MRPSQVELADANLGVVRVLVLDRRILNQHDVTVEACAADVLVLGDDLTGTRQLVPS